MTEPQPEQTGFGVYHPEAADYAPYNEAMAAWHNEVKAMTASDVPESAPEALEPPEATSDTTEVPESAPEEFQESEETSGESEEDPAEVIEPEAVVAEFDPGTRNAATVLNHLKGVGEAEAQRVLEAEAAGKARVGILNLSESILEQARLNDAK